MPKVRTNQDGQLHPTGLNAEPAFGQLSYGGTAAAFASAQHPNAEVLDGTGVVAGRSFLCTLDTAAGTISAPRAGEYDVELALADFSCGAASGNVQFTVQMAPDGTTFAGFGTSEATGGGDRMQAIRLAATGKAGLVIKKRVVLPKGAKVRTIVTSAAGDIITVTEGSLTLTQVADRTTGLPSV